MNTLEPGKPDPVATPQRPSCVAGLLIGGQSRRMGQSKAVMKLPDDRTMVEHVFGSLAPLPFDNVFLLGTCTGLPESLSQTPTIADKVKEGGPLSGLCALFEASSAEWHLLIGCDLPLMKTQTINRLLDHIEFSPDADAILFARNHKNGMSSHACCALYHRRLLAAGTKELLHGQKRLQNILDQKRCTILKTTAADRRGLTNVNTPLEFEQAMRNLGISS